MIENFNIVIQQSNLTVMPYYEKQAKETQLSLAQRKKLLLQKLVSALASSYLRSDKPNIT